MHDDNKARGSNATPPKPPATLSEVEFLDRQAAEARGAIADKLAQMRQSLKEAGDVRAWARAYPWATLGAAVAAGFVAAKVIRPKPPGAFDREPALLERILTDEQIAQRLRELAGEDDAQSPVSPVHTFATVMLKTFGPALQSAVASALAARAAQETAPPADGNSDSPLESGQAPPE